MTGCTVRLRGGVEADVLELEEVREEQCGSSGVELYRAKASKPRPAIRNVRNEFLPRNRLLHIASHARTAANKPEYAL